MPSAKELREKRAAGPAKAILQLRDTMNAQGYAADPADEENWTKANDDYNALSRQIEREETAERIDAEAKAAVPLKPGLGDYVGRAASDGHSLELTDGARALALAGWLNAFTPRGPSQEQADACRTAGLNPFSKEIGIGLYATEDANRLKSQWRGVHPNRARDHVTNFRATLTTGSGPSGGYLIAPEDLRRNLEINMLAYGGMRQVSETIRTTSGELMSWPTADDTTNTGVQLGESTTIGSSVDPSFGKVLWSAYKFSSKPILVPYELLQDSVFNLPAVLGDMLGERLGRITNTKFTTGTGAATCKGIITAAASFGAASATAITWDDVLGLEHSVDPAYRSGGSYMMHDSILLYCRKLKDGIGQYLWQNGLSVGSPDTFNRQPLTINQDMDSTVASGKKTILWGQLSRYKIRTVGQVRLYRLEERYRDTDQDAFIAFTREDGNLLTAGTAPVKYLSH